MNVAEPVTGREFAARPKQWVRFGPYLILGAVPWLLLATGMRLRVLTAPSAAVLVLTVLAHLALLIAFLVASDRAIKLAGGVTSLERLPLSGQLRLARGILGRLLALCFAITLVALALGFRGEPVVIHWVAFEGIVFNWRMRVSVLALSPVAAAIVFMMVVEKGAGREPRLMGALWQIAMRWRHLVPAMLAVAVFLALSMHLRTWLGTSIRPSMGPLADTHAEALVYWAFLSAFAYLHLWAVVNILTYALRASYRGQRPNSVSSDAGPPTH